MQVKTSLQAFVFGNNKVQLFVPDALDVQQRHKEFNHEQPAPYWAKIWPAAQALCSFLADNPHFIQNKKVLEIAAGLGLPSLLAVNNAAAVICSDIDEEAIELVNKSITASSLQNIEAIQLDWNQLPKDLTTEVLLLSDINYDPSVFLELEKMIQHFLDQQATIIISTPQRLMAKPFIEKLLSFTTYQTTVEVKEEITSTPCSIYVLQPLPTND